MNGEIYQGYGVTTTVAEAQAAFAARHGYAAREVIVSKGAVLAGPIRPSLLSRVAAAQQPLTAARARQMALRFEEV